MDNTSIYYFTGTGNSYFVAENLQKLLKDAEIRPLIRVLNKNASIKLSGKVGFVFPIYQSIMPYALRLFLERADLSDCEYLFAIATRLGTTHRAFEMMDKILAKQGKVLSLFYSINMANNDPKFNYHVPTTDDLAEIESKALESISWISDKIQQSVAYRANDQNYLSKTPALGLLSGLAQLTEKSYSGFYEMDTCTGCGICERVCTSGKITMNGSKPTWNKQTPCYKCSACLNFCPVQAIQIKHFTEKNGRYPHPYGTIELIAAQKEF